MSILAGQQRTLLKLLSRVRPYWRTDLALPARIEKLLRGDRRFGSRDRRLYRELVYTTLRHLPWMEPLLERDPPSAVRAIGWLAAETAATRDFRAAAALGTGPAPGTVAGKAAGLRELAGDLSGTRLLPSWFEAECPEAFLSPTYDVLNTRPPLWLRVQTPDAGQVFGEFASKGWAWRAADAVPGALELLGEADVTRTEAYRRGLIEVQDAGSQRILETAKPEPGGCWLDACAGAGGKALQLASLLGPGGSVHAHDVRGEALAELEVRVSRAGLGGRVSRPSRLLPSYDGVLVDAPCSGTGTWRRAPHLKWTTSVLRVRACARLQESLLARYAALVRPGGILVYATCSLCRSENEDVVTGFLSAFPSFAPDPRAHPGGDPLRPGSVLWPEAHNGDGYYVAVLART
jgi:16S rRNA (cytosine967-C5)-methyltransferase